MKRLDVKAYVDGVRGRDRAVLARAITLIESEQPAHAELAQQVLEALLPETGGAYRVGVSGVPGAGKSTFIDALGTQLTSGGHRVAVLAVDPTSSVSGGSILGDKTRMSRLSNDANAFIRPSPTSGTLGGVTRKTRETILICEAAGFDVVLVETVGVGQSETIVAGMVDFFLVLLIAGAGDELQGIKRGILEVADMLAINKADGDNQPRAIRAQASYRSALRLMRGEDVPPVVTCSAIEKTGLDEIWALIVESRRGREASGELQRTRSSQQVRWMWDMVEDGLRRALRGDDELSALIAQLEDAVGHGQTTASAAARKVLRRFADRAGDVLRRD
ncbi:MAG: methylmalonyl Co-A mutase-associated GTPase MeaB [Deltaproteobacteria bacterium]|nr:methylmalonyl Co-A mutase-associated GTPase MeaB [Deltaproteobacteria bacterium]NND28616.1 methylmalonyl Co-A mutase-associated GTPase MeaB [Myxococcales bacterium]MBT8463208.1 methylmalonyl Co-A mutase-associated GTPase MeaB [Deltaproteobacteria bacterium]MBT8481346.1 methylmalonyl Co-A mutase-associated GTPase MeaB [Deltaproteobacteria bacterium]NNK06964.1 methylmalonyl Co-A mutase-associated GTPase MeaB [Myxococcales bacterium]